jgi:predicted Rossmann-fold nucleotide-binding protein
MLNFPVVIMGKQYYEPLINFIRQMIEAGTIAPEDLDLLLVTDSPDEAMKHIQDTDCIKESSLSRYLARPILRPRYEFDVRQ